MFGGGGGDDQSDSDSDFDDCSSMGGHSQDSNSNLSNRSSQHSQSLHSFPSRSSRNRPYIRSPPHSRHNNTYRSQTARTNERKQGIFPHDFDDNPMPSGLIHHGDTTFLCIDSPTIEELVEDTSHDEKTPEVRYFLCFPFVYVGLTNN